MILLLSVLGIIILTMLAVSILFRYEIEAALARDPAARNYSEVMLLYSGLHALILYRLSHALLNWRIPVIPRLISQLGRHITGIEIHPGAKISKGLFIDHGMGVVIGETAIIGDNVTLYQGVTLGGTGKVKGKRHPTIGSNVVIGAGAKVLGDITVGDNSYIGANAVVIKDVPPNSTAVGVPARLTREDGKKIEEGLDHAHIHDPVTQQLDSLRKRIEDLEGKRK